jgi:hypothetical protein
MRSRRGQRRRLARREVSPSWSERQRRLQGLRILFEIFVEYAYVLESLDHIYSCKLNLFDPKTKMQSFVYQIIVLICTFFVSIQFNLCLVFLNNLLFLSK